MIKLEPILKYTPIKTDLPKISYLKLCNPIKDTFEFQKKDILSLSKDEILKKINHSIKPEYSIGKGSEAEVYKIDGTNYCVRISKKDNPQQLKNLSFDLSQEDKINHIVAKIGAKSSIMKYIEGYPLLLGINKKYDVTQQQVNKLVCNLPSTAFHNLLKQICHAQKYGMTFDHSWTNLIVNPKENTLTAIDFYKDNFADYEEFLPLRKIYVALMHDTPEEKKKCINLLINGALEEFKPKIKPEININDIHFYDFMQHVERGDIQVRANSWHMLKNTLSEIEKLKSAEQKFNQDVSSQLSGRIKIAQALLNQI